MLKNIRLRRFISLLLLTVVLACDIPVLNVYAGEEEVVISDETDHDTEAATEAATEADTENREDISDLLYSCGAFPSSYDFDLSGIAEGGIEADPFCNVVKTQILSPAESNLVIDVTPYGLNLSKVKGRLATLLNTLPEVFYVDSSFSYTLSENACVKSITLSYKERPSASKEIKTDGNASDKAIGTSYHDQIEEMNRVVSAVIRSMDSRWTQEEQLLYLYQWLCDNCDYDDSKENSSAYDAIVQGCAVCCGYASAMEVLSKAAGIECPVIQSRDLNHAFNLAKINGNWYYLDSTWDGQSRYTSHHYLLLSRDAFAVRHRTTDWEGFIGDDYLNVYENIKTPTDHDEYWWSSTARSIPYVAGGWLHFDSDYIRKYDYTCNSDDLFYEFKNCHKSLFRYIITRDKYVIISIFDTMILIDRNNGNICEEYKVDPEESSGNFVGIHDIRIVDKKVVFTSFHEMSEGNKEITVDWSAYDLSKTDVMGNPDLNEMSNNTFGTYSLVVKQKLDVAAIARDQMMGTELNIAKFQIGSPDLKGVGTVNSKGIFTAKKQGITSVDIYTRNGVKYYKIGSVVIHTFEPQIAVPSKDLTYEGEELKVSEYISDLPEGTQLSWSIPAKKAAIATVDEASGTVRAGAKNGTVKLSCMIKGIGDHPEYYIDAKYSFTIKVKHPKFKKAVIKIKNGKTKTITLSNVSSYTNVEWKVDGNAEFVPTNKTSKIKLTANGTPGDTINVRAIVDEQEYNCQLTIK